MNKTSIYEKRRPMMYFFRFYNCITRSGVFCALFAFDGWKLGFYGVRNNNENSLTIESAPSLTIRVIYGEKSGGNLTMTVNQLRIRHMFRVCKLLPKLCAVRLMLARKTRK